MTEYDVLDLYKKDLSVWALIIKHFKQFIKIILFILLILEVILIVIGILGSIIQLWNGILAYISLLMFFLIGLLIMYIINIEYKRILKNNYDIDSDNFLWNRSEFSKMKLRRLGKILEERNLNGKNRIKYLIELTEKAQDELKTPFFLNKGILFSVLLAIFIQFVAWVYNEMVNSLETALVFELILVILVLGIFYGISLVKFIINDVFSSYEKMKRLTEDLRRIYLYKIND